MNNNRGKRKLGLLTLVAVAVAGCLIAVAYFLLDAGYVRFNYPSAEEYPIRGIDVSHHQGVVDWAQVKAAGTTFAFIKATEGGDFTDPQFSINWREAARANIIRGAYHFFTFCRPVADQLQHIVATVPVEAGTFPPVLDLEFGGNCSRQPTGAEMSSDLRFLVDGIKAHYGQNPIFYVTNEFLDAYYTPDFPPVVIWIRDVFWEPSLPEGLDWHIWQFANRGHLAGITGVVDLNVFDGDLAALKKLLL